MRRSKRERIAAEAVKEFIQHRDEYHETHNPTYSVQFTQWPDSVRWTVWDSNPDTRYAVEGFLVPYAMGDEPTAAEAGKAAAEWVLGRAALGGTDHE